MNILFHAEFQCNVILFSFYQTISIIMLCPISVLLSFCYSYYVVLNIEWNQNGERMVSETLTSATLILIIETINLTILRISINLLTLKGNDVSTDRRSFSS